MEYLHLNRDAVYTFKTTELPRTSPEARDDKP
jgi:hypothetical protein